MGATSGSSLRLALDGRPEFPDAIHCPEIDGDAAVFTVHLDQVDSLQTSVFSTVLQVD